MTKSADSSNSSLPQNKVLVIGYGNSLRGDDAAGQIIVEKIESLKIKNVDTLALQQLTPDIAEIISRYQIVFFVDASDDKLVNEVQVLDIKHSDNAPRIEHAMTPEDLLRLTHELYAATPTPKCIIIPAQNFEFSEVLSPLTESFIEPAIKIIIEQIKLFH